MAALVTFCAVINCLLWAAQSLLLGRRIARTEIREAPVFIIGHWRSGTTLLHELLALDPRHACPDTYECFAPNHFLISGWVLRRTMGFLLPKRRPMDNVTAGWDRPQEDEFALCNMGVPSPYLTIPFPNHPPQCQEYLDLEGVPAEERQRWKRSLLWFLKCVTVRRPRRLVLKSPPHTCRIKALLELFPEARFVHIVRDPYVLFPSTLRLWRRLYYDQGFQRPKYEGLEDHIFKTLDRMYEAFRRDRPLIAPSQICEVRYEDLVRDPIGQLQTVYAHLQLDGFDEVLPVLEKHVATMRDYQTNRYQISEETRAEITRRWKGYLEQYGYGREVAEV
jgi:hypothetical protein